MNEIDDTDRKILTELQRDATLALDALSDRIALSRNATWRRIKRLEEQGVIKERVALLCPDAMDVGLMVLVSVSTRNHDAKWAKGFLTALEAFPEITGAWRTSGQVDYVLQVRVKDVKAYDALYKRLIERVDLEDVSASFVMEEIKATTALPI